MKSSRFAGRSWLVGAALVGLLAGCDGAVIPADARVARAEDHGLVRITGASPFTDCGPNDFFGDGFASAEVETMVAVSPDRPSDLVVTWFQDASLTYASAVSRDGGAHWQVQPVRGISRCDGGDAHAGADSWLSIAPGGAVYLSGFSVYLDLLPAPLPTRTTMQVSRATLGPERRMNWSDPVVVQAGAGVFHDRPVVTADPDAPDTAYVLWNDGTQVPPLVVQPLMFARTDDGGATWSAPVPVHLPTGGISHEGEIHVLPDGALLATFVTIRANPFTHVVMAARSEDGGRTWPAAPTVVAEYPAGNVGASPDDCRTIAAPIRDPDTGRCVQMPENELSADAAPDGTVYVTWRQRAGDAQADVVVTRSTDGGRTWAAPVAVSATPGEKGIPALAVEAGGTVGVSWYDFRSDLPGDDLFSAEIWFASSADGGTTWRERRIAGPTDLRSAPYRRIPVEGLFIGDYQGLAALPGGFAAVFPLARPQAVDGATDLFFARIPLR